MSVQDSKNLSRFHAAVTELRRYFLTKGNYFERGTSFRREEQVFSGIEETIQLYEKIGYSKLLEIGHPPIYAMLERGHREVHIFQPQDERFRKWLEDKNAALDDPAMRTYLLQLSGLTESDIPVTTQPHRYRINEIDNIFIATTDD